MQVPEVKSRSGRCPHRKAVHLTSIPHPRCDIRPCIQASARIGSLRSARSLSGIRRETRSQCSHSRVCSCAAPTGIRQRPVHMQLHGMWLDTRTCPRKKRASEKNVLDTRCDISPSRSALRFDKAGCTPLSRTSSRPHEARSQANTCTTAEGPCGSSTAARSPRYGSRTRPCRVRRQLPRSRQGRCSAS